MRPKHKVRNVDIVTLKRRAAGFAVHWRRSHVLTPDLHIRARSVLDRLELAAADDARRYRLRILGSEPVQPVRPPGARMFGGLGQR